LKERGYEVAQDAPSEGELLFRLQPAEYTDGIAEDGTESVKSPRPFLFNQDGWLIGEDFWQGRAVMIVGLSANLSEETIDLPWEEAVLDHSKMVGMYAVTRSEAGDFHTLNMAIKSVQKAQFKAGEWQVVS
jgi:hypothetical protein